MSQQGFRKRINKLLTQKDVCLASKHIGKQNKDKNSTHSERTASNIIKVQLGDS